MERNQEIYRDPTQPVESRVADLLGRMTLEEKIEQMHGVQREPIDHLYQTPANDRLGIPGFRMVDGPRGVRAGKATAFPVGMARGASFDPDLEQRVGAAIGAETSAKGGNVLLAPVVNVLRHPRWGRAQETYGEDPYHLGVMGAAFITGAQRHVVASVKHFAANSIENNRFTVSANLSERTLREIYLPHFARAVRAGVGSVMSAYNRVNVERERDVKEVAATAATPHVERERDVKEVAATAATPHGTWCSEHPLLLREILKGEWGFDGFVESDWIFGVHDTAGAALAGLDIEMPRPKVYGKRLLAAVEAGEVPVAAIDDAVCRILRIMFRFGIFDGRPRVDPSVVASPAHVALAREAAQKSIVLLRNENALLPLDRAAVRRIAVIGELAGLKNLGDHGSSYVSPPYVVTPLDGIRTLAPDAAIDPILSDAPSAAQLERIAGADAAIVVVGLTTKDEGEGQIAAGDRVGLELSTVQEQLICDVAAANPRTVVVLEGGSAIVVERWIERVGAVLLAWYPGMEGGHAIAEVVFGEVNPAARLPITFARGPEQLPTFDNEHDDVDYDGLHGYRLADANGFAPRFPFGFGLSYATFAYRALALETAAPRRDGALRVTIELSNTGARAGDEVVQLYVGCTGSRVARAPRELRAFARVRLEPGETRQLVLEVPIAELAYYDVDERAWLVEDADYTAYVGPSSRELPLRASFRVRDV